MKHFFSLILALTIPFYSAIVISCGPSGITGVELTNLIAPIDSTNGITNLIPVYSTSNDIVFFKFSSTLNPYLITDCQGKIEGSNIYITIPYHSVDFSNLIPTYYTTGDVVKVNGVTQTSGLTAINYCSNTIEYLVVSEAGNSNYYHLYINHFRDILFIIESDGSMASEIAMVRSGLGSMVNHIESQGIDCRYAIFLIGGLPELFLDFTSSNSLVLSSISLLGTARATTTEDGMEVMYMSLGNEMMDSPYLDWRPDSLKTIIFIGDEDCDPPAYEFHRGYFQHLDMFAEPSTYFYTNALDPFYKELDFTAGLLILSNVQLYTFTSTFKPTIAFQYGDFAKNVHSPDFSDFDFLTTISNYIAASNTYCLNYRLLSAGLQSKSFDICNIDDAGVIDNIFSPY